MAKFKLLCVAVLIAFSIPAIAVPIGTSLQFTLVRTPISYEPEEEEGRRIPGKPFTCTFDSETGIEFIGQETPEFSLYEIYVTDTECIYASGDEFDFINKLFTLSGSYQICLTTTDGCVYAGYINL